jgi:hypothetical protein
VLRRREGTCFSSPSDDEVGGCQARSGWSELGERNNQARIARRCAEEEGGDMFSSPSDDEVGGCQARAGWSELGERNNQKEGL